MSNLNPLPQATADWRRTLQVNNQKTFFVISLFFLIYLSLGLLVDAYINASHYPTAPLSAIFLALMTFKLIPYATLIMLGIASISLWVTLTWHNELMLLGADYRQITPETAQSLHEKQFYNIIEELKIASGLNYMPKVFIIEADYMNAFASGYSEKSAMVAITRGLMNKLDRDELQAVMAHEMSHIRHMDIKLTLMASLLTNLILIILDVMFYSVFFSRRGSEDRSRNNLAVIVMLLRYLLPVINVLLLLYLSRTREYMADAGCVELTRDNRSLASALLKINGDYAQNQEFYNQLQPLHENVRREAYIFDPIQAGIASTASLADLFSTHPNLKDRLAALGFHYNG